MNPFWSLGNLRSITEGGGNTLNLILLLKNSYGATCSGFGTTGTQCVLSSRAYVSLHKYCKYISPALRNWGNFSISFWTISPAENSLSHRHFYFKHNYVSRKKARSCCLQNTKLMEVGGFIFVAGFTWKNKIEKKTTHNCGMQHSVYDHTPFAQHISCSLPLLRMASTVVQLRSKGCLLTPGLWKRPSHPISHACPGQHSQGCTHCTAQALLWSSRNKGKRLEKEHFPVRKYLPTSPQAKKHHHRPSYQEEVAQTLLEHRRGATHAQQAQ